MDIVLIFALQFTQSELDSLDLDSPPPSGTWVSLMHHCQIMHHCHWCTQKQC